MHIELKDVRPSDAEEAEMGFMRLALERNWFARINGVVDRVTLLRLMRLTAMRGSVGASVVDVFGPRSPIHRNHISAKALRKSVDRLVASGILRKDLQGSSRRAIYWLASHPEWRAAVDAYSVKQRRFLAAMMRASRPVAGNSPGGAQVVLGYAARQIVIAMVALGQRAPCSGMAVALPLLRRALAIEKHSLGATLRKLCGSGILDIATGGGNASGSVTLRPDALNVVHSINHPATEAGVNSPVKYGHILPPVITPSQTRASITTRARGRGADRGDDPRSDAELARADADHLEFLSRPEAPNRTRMDEPFASPGIPARSVRIYPRETLDPALFDVISGRLSTAGGGRA